MPRPKPQEGTTDRMTIVLPVAVVARIKKVASKTATPPSVLVRQWIIERLDQIEGETR